MKIFALDTNIISYLLRGEPIISTRLQQENDRGNLFTIPPLVYYEIKRGLLADNSSKRLRSFENFCKAVSVGKMTLDVLDEAARQYAYLRRNGRPVDDADILIAAFCIVNSYILVTNNTKHFTPMDMLQIINWT